MRKVIKVGQTYRVKSMINIVDRNYRNRLLSMGLLPGAELEITRIAPLGDPIQLKVNEFALSLRKNELQQLDLESV